MTKVLKAVALAALIAGPSLAQQSPPGLDWRQIQTERFKVVFPAAISADAQRVANTLEHIYGPVSKTLRGPHKPIDIVLVNPLGYFLTTYVKRRYGPETWDKVLGRTAWWGFHPFSFSRALRKYTGASAAQTYERTMDELTELWQTQQKDLRAT